MTLHQHRELRLWYLRHWRRNPVEKNLWDAVLVLWVMGWVGGPVSWVLQLPWAIVASLAGLLLPGLYVDREVE